MEPRQDHEQAERGGDDEQRPVIKHWPSKSESANCSGEGRKPKAQASNDKKVPNHAAEMTRSMASEPSHVRRRCAD